MSQQQRRAAAATPGMSGDSPGTERTAACPERGPAYSRRVDRASRPSHVLPVHDTAAGSSRRARESSRAGRGAGRCGWRGGRRRARASAASPSRAARLPPSRAGASAGRPSSTASSHRPFRRRACPQRPLDTGPRGSAAQASRPRRPSSRHRSPGALEITFRPSCQEQNGTVGELVTRSARRHLVDYRCVAELRSARGSSKRLSLCAPHWTRDCIRRRQLERRRGFAASR
jgi:hypothetical protein